MGVGVEFFVDLWYLMLLCCVDLCVVFFGKVVICVVEVFFFVDFLERG